MVASFKTTGRLRVLYIYFSLYTCGVVVFPVWFVYHRVLTTQY